MEQVQKSRQTTRQESTIEDQPTPAAQADLSITDDLLDEIDSILEQNAEEFVRSFIQKGGQ